MCFFDSSIYSSCQDGKLRKGMKSFERYIARSSKNGKLINSALPEDFYKKRLVNVGRCACC